MTKKILFAFAAIAALTLSFSSCKKDDQKNNGGNNTTTNIRFRIDTKEIAVLVGQTAEIQVSVEPKDTKITFESANAEIASVDDKGIVTGVAVGETVIKVTAAGTITKEAKIKVMDPNSLDEKRYIGTPDEKGLIAPFYVVEATKIPDLKGIIKTANEAKGWMFTKVLDLGDGIKAFHYMAPNDGKVYTDKRLVGELEYLYFPDKKENYMVAYTKLISDEDLIKKVCAQDKDAKDLIFGFAANYGFDKGQVSGKYKDGTKVAVAYNMSQFPEGPYELAMTSIKDKETGKYALKLQIVQRNPQTQSSLTNRQPLMPELQNFSSFKQISER